VSPNRRVVMDEELEALMRQAMVHALPTSPADLGVELSVLGRMEWRHVDEISAFTALFEEHGYRGARTNALDIVTTAAMGVDRKLPVIWPLHPDASAAEVGGSGVVMIDGVVQRNGLHARTVLCPVNDRLVSLAVSSVEEQITGETAVGSPWVRVQVWGRPSDNLGPWPEVRRRARLALASELVGVSRRINDIAAVHNESPRRPSRQFLAVQTARSRLTRASAKIADVRALIAACWAEGSVEAAERAVTAATAAHDAVAHQVTTIRGDINLAQLHPMRFLVEQGHGRTHRFPTTRAAAPPVS
jgi:hypothetical protein